MVFSPHLMFLTLLVLASHMMLGDAVVTVTRISASGLAVDESGTKPDPYIKAWCNGVYGGKTSSGSNNSSPSWIVKFDFSDCKAGHTLKLEVWDKNLFFDKLLGSCSHKVLSGSNTSRCTLIKGSLSSTPAKHAHHAHVSFKCYSFLLFV
ncbi:perforin-1-like [Astyanax mexicanus]|uniref:Perforin-1-like n=1 Tax=Astyanax mexicanus TaxID=7994 RepID=A0A8T2KWS3_ASTMX|nr:perforin-1-like [Astyanax mexicanus]